MPSHLRPALTRAEPPVHSPNAALLIDFDNVTLGVRSEFTKELRTLLNSDIIKGKVAVQRAYADWRRYPQYIVPLSESSIDLIFAPAFGSVKKNATDIRLAIDAIELVFTRPEIGTFILLSGDSDFSMLVIKLKEYGKYVIGVGIRESASDILIQNCDEYFSYSDLAGLTKEPDTPSAQRDPWELVKEAAAQMVKNGDVMRSDRLKQVMQQIDSNFDERNAGFNRFSKFVTEAGSKGLIKVTKLDNGQYEIAPTARSRRCDSEPRRARRPATPGRNGEPEVRRGAGARPLPRAVAAAVAGAAIVSGPRRAALHPRSRPPRATRPATRAPAACRSRARSTSCARPWPSSARRSATRRCACAWRRFTARTTRCSPPRSSRGCCARPTMPRSPTCARSARTSSRCRSIPPKIRARGPAPGSPCGRPATAAPSNGSEPDTAAVPTETAPVIRYGVRSRPGTRPAIRPSGLQLVGA